MSEASSHYSLPQEEPHPWVVAEAAGDSTLLGMLLEREALFSTDNAGISGASNATRPGDVIPGHYSPEELRKRRLLAEIDDYKYGRRIYPYDAVPNPRTKLI